MMKKLSKEASPELWNIAKVLGGSVTFNSNKEGSFAVITIQTMPRFEFGVMFSINDFCVEKLNTIEVKYWKLCNIESEGIEAEYSLLFQSNYTENT